MNVRSVNRWIELVGRFDKARPISSVKCTFIDIAMTFYDCIVQKYRTVFLFDFPFKILIIIWSTVFAFSIYLHISIVSSESISIERKEKYCIQWFLLSVEGKMCINGKIGPNVIQQRWWITFDVWSTIFWWDFPTHHLSEQQFHFILCVCLFECEFSVSIFHYSFHLIHFNPSSIQKRPKKIPNLNDMIFISIRFCGFLSNHYIFKFASCN